jgi:alpha-tubulin suppressor-like RCC1 family protein
VSGTAYCWGEDTDGQIGNGTMPDNGVIATPVAVTGLGGGGNPTTAVASMGYHGCAIVSGGYVDCWGWNTYGAVGTGVAIDGKALSAVSVQGLPSGAKAIATGEYHSCALVTNGTVWCWGNETYGQLGNAVLKQDGVSATPVQVMGLPTGLQVTSIAAGAEHNCVIMSNGSVWCWGDGNFGELGNGTATSSSPVQVTGW